MAVSGLSFATDKITVKFVYVTAHSTDSYLTFYYVQGTSLSAEDMTENKTEKNILFLDVYTHS